MFIENIADLLLFEPLRRQMNELIIITAYATPNMLSWYIKNLHRKTKAPIKISLIIGMVPFDGVSLSIHEGFRQILNDELPQEVESLECSYIYDEPAVHSNVVIWARDGEPSRAFTGSQFFVQNSFIGNHRQESVEECSPVEAMRYYNSLEARCIYVNHAEIEEYIRIYQSHPILDNENSLKAEQNLELQENVDHVTLSLVTRKGSPGEKSGLNWGQRPGRNPNEAYIPLPRKVARSGFFPLEKQHFTALTDDRHQLILRIEQQGDKAITTPARNSDLGEYFRNRLGVASGDPVTAEALSRYGRSDVEFIRLDEETYYMDFSV